MYTLLWQLTWLGFYEYIDGIQVKEQFSINEKEWVLELTYYVNTQILNTLIYRITQLNDPLKHIGNFVYLFVVFFIFFLQLKIFWKGFFLNEEATKTYDPSDEQADFIHTIYIIYLV